MEYVLCLKRVFHDPDLCPVFWVFVFVCLGYPYPTTLFSDGRLQNRYFPVTFQFWQLGGRCLTSLLKLRGVMTNARRITVAYGPQSQLSTMVSFIWQIKAFYSQRGHAGVHRVLDVRMSAGGLWIPPQFLSSHENRCQETSWYPLVVFLVCTSVAQVVLTTRSGVSFLDQRPGLTPENSVTGYTL